jgi:WD40 repeat protein
VGGNAYARKPDGQIASEVAIWDVTSGKLQRALRGFRYLAHKVAYSSDGTRLAACSDDATVQIWESDTGRLVRVLRGGSSIRALGWNHTGNRLYASTFRGGTFGWDVETGQRLPRLPDTSDESLFLAVSPNSRHLATRPSQGGVGVWDLNTRKLLWTKTRIPHAVTFSPDNQLLACAVGELVRLHAVADGRQVCSFGGHEGPVLGVAFSPCGQLLATGGADSTVRIWDVEEGRVLSVWRGHLGRVETVAFHPHGAIVASGSAQPGEIKLWDLTRPQGHIPCARPTRGGRVETLSFAPEGHEIILARSTGIVERRDATTDVLRSSRWMPLGGFWRVPATLTAFSQDTRLLAGVSREENTVCVWNTQTGEALAGKYRHSVPAWFVAMSQQGQLVASGAFAIRDAELLSELAVWESATGQVRLRCKDVRVRVACLALTVDGKQLARCLIRLRKETDPTMIRFVPTDAVVEVWDVPAVGQAVPTAPRLSFRPADSMIRGLAFSCDGTMLAGSSDEGTLFLWDLAAGQPLHPRALPGPNMLEGLAFSPDGKLIAGVSRTEVAIWNVREGQEVLRLRGAPPRPSDGGFSPRIAWSNDGRRLAASNWDQSVSIWDTTDLKNPQMMQDRHSAALARLPGWHIDHAMRAWTRRQPTATHFHLAQIDRLGQLDPGWCLLRGEVYAQMGEWKKALADLDRGMTVVESPQGDLSRKHLLLRRMNGDHDGYQKGCAVLAEHLSHRIEASFLPQAVYTCVAAAESNVDPKVLVEVMREVTKKQQKSAWHHHVLALSCLRAKNYDESVTASQRSLALKPEESTRITTWLTLALAEHHRGNREEAQKWKTRAHDWIAVQRQVLAASNRQVPDAMSWCDWLVVQLLVREVEQTLEAA